VQLATEPLDAAKNHTICKSNKYPFHISLLTTTILLDGDFDIQNKTLE